MKFQVRNLTFLKKYIQIVNYFQLVDDVSIQLPLAVLQGEKKKIKKKKKVKPEELEE